jgi:hypothetical protein
MKWDYDLEVLANGEHENEDYLNYLNRRGSEGWEICGVVYARNRLTLYWKRPHERVELAPGSRYQSAGSPGAPL